MKKIGILYFVLLSCLPLIGADISWSSPGTISSATQNASDPHIGIDTTGNLVAVWIENGYVFASHLPLNGTWSPAIPLSTIGTASSAKLTVDSSGNANVIWIDGGLVYATAMPAGQNWTTPVALSSATSSYPDLTADSTGDVVAIWISGGALQSATKRAGGNWPSLPDIIATSGIDVAHVAMGANGTAVAVWHTVVSSTDTIYAASKLINGSWSTGQVISTSGLNSNIPHVAVDSVGNATAIWYSYNLSGTLYSNVNLQGASMLTGTNTWSTPTTISSTPGILGPSFLGSRVAYDGSGNVIAVWSSSTDGASYNVCSSRQLVNGTWGANQEYVGQDIYAYGSDLSVTSLGDSLVAIMYYDGNNIDIFTTEAGIFAYQFNLAFSQIASQGSINGFPKVAISNNGNTNNAGAIWLTFDGTHNNAQAVVGSASVLLPPSNLAVTQNTNNFGIFTETYNTISWDASTSDNISEYIIFRDGIWIGSTEPSTLQILDHNRIPAQSNTYGVATVDGENQQSQVVTISYH